ncbi:MAG: MerR family transcriptional regulator [Gammaproteobacteria bacterium]|nr:MerR family transcriptional regulator [Gammaproteobacteria bacterium]
MLEQNLSDLPPIPDKIYFTIGEVSDLCKLKSYVLRYWEQEFPQLKPNRRGNRRYYQYKDVVMVRQIRDLLYNQGFTIDGARVQLSKSDNTHNAMSSTKEFIKNALNSLEQILAELKTES